MRRQELERAAYRATALSTAFVEVKDVGRMSRKDKRSEGFSAKEGTLEGASLATKAVLGAAACQ
ncbi:MAG: hypothetical protein AB8B86_18995 [Pseudomonadales bacterium]